MNNFERNNWLLDKIKNNQIITFTFAFLLVYRFITTLFSFLANRQLFLESFKLDIWFFIIAIPILYFFQWLVVIWVASRFPAQRLKDKFYKHPITAIGFLILYLIDLPYRLSKADLGVGIWKLTNAFETVVYYAFISFFWWLLICWISSKLWKHQKYQWTWYRVLIDKIFVVMPIIFKVVLGLIVASFLFIVLFGLISMLSGYSGQDLKSIGK